MERRKDDNSGALMVAHLTKAKQMAQLFCDTQKCNGNYSTSTCTATTMCAQIK